MGNVKHPRTKEERIEFLQQQLAEREKKTAEYREKLQARIELITARGSSQDRKDNTRRKILSGAMVQDRLEKRKLSQQRFNKWMDDYLIRDDDRILFGLAPIDKTVTAKIDNDSIDVSEVATSDENDHPDRYNSGIAIDDSYLQLPNDFDNYN